MKELRDLVKQVAPTVLCVLETQVHKARVESLKGTLGYDNFFAASSSGRSGGLGIFWNNNTGVDFYRTRSTILMRLLSSMGGNRGG